MTGFPSIEKVDSISSEKLAFRILQIRKQRLQLIEEQKKRETALTSETIEKEKCKNSFDYFLSKYVHIYDSVSKTWIPFDLWDAQKDVADKFQIHKKIIVLKARQLGLTWLCLSYALWLSVFHPIQNILLFSLRDIEAKVLLSDERFEGMFSRLPLWMKPTVITNNGQEFTLSNGSSVKAFPTTAGDSYSATLVIVDEADLVPNLNQLLRRAEPTIDAGGQIFLISRADKETPMSDFKQIFRAAMDGDGGYFPIFLSWNVHPKRSIEWYERKKADTHKTTGSHDDLYEQYPASPQEALAAKELNARIPPRWIVKNYKPIEPMDLEIIENYIDIPNVKIFKLPEKNKLYYAGCDPAGGLEKGESASKKRRIDDSAISVIDEFGEECALIYGKYEPALTAVYLASICEFYNDAEAMVLRRNHGYAVILKMRETYPSIELMYGIDRKAGWDESEKGKMMMYSQIAEDLRDSSVTIHSSMVSTQLTSIESATLKAPEGMHDDCADSFTTANLARNRSIKVSDDDDTSGITSLLM